MSESYERERQNNAQLDELARKVTALRGVTVDIYDNARNQEVIDSSVCISSYALARAFYVLCRMYSFPISKLVLPLSRY